MLPQHIQAVFIDYGSQFVCFTNRMFYNVTGNRLLKADLYVAYDSSGRLAPGLLTATELGSFPTHSDMSFTFCAVTHWSSSI